MNGFYGMDDWGGLSITIVSKPCCEEACYPYITYNDETSGWDYHMLLITVSQSIVEDEVSCSQVSLWLTAFYQPTNFCMATISTTQRPHHHSTPEYNSAMWWGVGHHILKVTHCIKYSRLTITKAYKALLLRFQYYYHKCSITSPTANNQAFSSSQQLSRYRIIRTREIITSKLYVTATWPMVKSINQNKNDNYLHKPPSSE